VSARSARSVAPADGEPRVPIAQPPSSATPPPTGLQTFDDGSHTAPGAQSEDAEHCVMHSPVGPHRYGEQGVVVPSFATDESRSSEHFATSGLQTPVTQAKPSAQ
jgi:hypothetical protein